MNTTMTVISTALFFGLLFAAASFATVPAAVLFGAPVLGGLFVGKISG